MKLLILSIILSMFSSALFAQKLNLTIDAQIGYKDLGWNKEFKITVLGYKKDDCDEYPKFVGEIYSKKLDKVKEGFKGTLAKFSIDLPKDVNHKIWVKVEERDFTIPIPGPCCISINENDVYSAHVEINDLLNYKSLTVPVLEKTYGTLDERLRRYNDDSLTLTVNLAE